MPAVVVRELANGLAQGVYLPDPTQIGWCTICTPKSAYVLSLVSDLGAGETAVLALALEAENAVVALDDAQARWRAEMLNRDGGIIARCKACRAD